MVIYVLMHSRYIYFQSNQETYTTTKHEDLNDLATRQTSVNCMVVSSLTHLAHLCEIIVALLGESCFLPRTKKNKTTYQYSYADISLPDRNGFCRTMNTWAASGTISFPVGMGCVVFHVICHCELRIVHFGTRELCKEFYLCAILVNLCDLHQTIWINRESH